MVNVGFSAKTTRSYVVKFPFVGESLTVTDCSHFGFRFLYYVGGGARKASNSLIVTKFSSCSTQRMCTNVLLMTAMTHCLKIISEIVDILRSLCTQSFTFQPP